MCVSIISVIGEGKIELVQCPHCDGINPSECDVCQSCGSSLELSQVTFSYDPDLKKQLDSFFNLESGVIFSDRYKILQEIGKGGMGIVYKAEDKVLNTVIALKIIHPFYSSNPDMIRRFKQETLLARSISHENVVRIHDIREFMGMFYITMDFVQGKNLREIVRLRGPQPIPLVVETAKQICRALDAAHQKEIIHRDLKPHNILVDTNGRVLVSDFGLAKSLGDIGTAISEGVVGTPAYMSPEQAKAEPVDKRSDIYSLGVILYEMLTGVRPFEADDQAGYIKQHVEAPPRPPREINPFIPVSLENIVLKCLEKNKLLRPQSAQEILRYLDCLALTPTALLVQKLNKFKYALGGFLLLLLLGIGSYFVFWRGVTSAVPPGASGKIMTPMIIGLAMIESLVIYSLVISFMLLGKF